MFLKIIFRAFCISLSKSVISGTLNACLLEVNSSKAIEDLIRLEVLLKMLL